MLVKNYPLTYCLHPTTYYNKYLQEEIVTGCGKCAACLNKRSERLKSLVDLHASAYKFCFYVTLTYNQQNIPHGWLCHDDENTYLYDEDGVVLSSCPLLSDEDLHKLYVKVQSKEGHSLPYGAIPYLRSHDVRLFLIRLRQRVSCKKHRVVKQHDTKKYRLEINKFRTDEKFTYYLIGEYGPETFRPHFHLLFFFNEHCTLQALEHHVCAAWPYGHCDKTLSDLHVVNYLTSYVTGTSYLPSLYASPSVRPFARKSLHFGFDAQESHQVQIIDFEFYRNRGFNKTIGGKDRFFRFTTNFASSIYPKITGLGQIPFDCLLARYQLAPKLRAYYAKLARIDERNITIKFLIECLKQSYKAHVNPKPMHDAALDLYNFDFSDNPEKDMYTVNTLYRILLCSKLFYKNYTTLQLNPKSYVRRIIDFWQSEKLAAYNNSLANLETCTDDVIDLFYHPLLEPHKVQNTSLYQDFSYNSQKEALEKIKHKSINDLNKVLYNF